MTSNEIYNIMLEAGEVVFLQRPYSWSSRYGEDLRGSVEYPINLKIRELDDDGGFVTFGCTNGGGWVIESQWVDKGIVSFVEEVMEEVEI